MRGTFARAWNIAVRTRGVFTHRAGFQKLACAKRGLVRTGQHLGGRAWCARRVNYSQASSEPTTSPAPEATRQSNQQPRQHHTSTRITNAKSHTPTAAPAPETTRRLHQRFLYCDGETPNISLKYFAKYFCVPKPTASETSTTLSPASADNSWAALLSRMVRMNTEGFIP